MGRPKSLDRGERFLEVLSTLSTRFATIPYNNIDTEIDGWLERICRSLGFDRSVIAEYLPDRSDFYTTYQWNREGFPPAPGPMSPASDFLPWVSSKGATGEIVTVSDVSRLPREAVRDRAFMSGDGPRAILGVPLIVETRLVAGITFEDFHGTRRWTTSLMARLKLVSDIFANTLDRKHLALEAIKAKEEAQNIARLAVLGEMAAAIAHELSHPLGAILANAQAAKRLLDDANPNLGELKETLDDVITGERRAAAYVNEVRSLFRKSELHIEPLNAELLLDMVGSLTKPDLQAKGISLEMRIEAGLPLVIADRIGLEQAMINLIQNAADALMESPRSQPRRVVLHAFRRDARRVGIAVSDNGNGIAKDQLSKIFQPLFTTKRKGTGMGLGIVRSIVESHGSSIVVRSEREVGTTFEFDIPIVKRC